MTRKRNRSMLLILCLLPALTGCTGSGNEATFDGEWKKEATLKVMVSSEDFFMREYGELFLIQHPNMTIEFVPYEGRDIVQTVAEQEQDVMALLPADFNLLYEKGALYDLHNLITDDRFDLDRMHPGIVEALKQQGGGRLYGLPPFYLNLAIYYNKKVFDRYSIPYPTDNMTWEELFQLASRFAGLGEDIFGLYSSLDAGFLTSLMASSHDVQLFNPTTLTVTAVTPSVSKLAGMLVDAYRTGALAPPASANEEDPFIQGKSAMAIDYSYYINNVIRPAEMKQGSDFKPDWDIVTPPSDARNRESSSFTYYSEIYTVNAKSPYPQAAWQLVKFVNSDEMARLRSRTVPYMLPTRTQYIWNVDGKHVEALYSQRPNLNELGKDFSRVPKGFASQLDSIVNQEIAKVRAGTQTLEEALKSVQERGQQQLDEEIAAEKGGTE
ncbi:ABC transporter substrate-binding protein [Cohnella massiliensis]|uniref:ABC transporter substrate-binding protein n=1 Tax=Cohnella massiliensis TaxID=1816691 RepID=UPI0009BBEE2A|nr:extracellular solute-binding protein [Cohnella massiliensis]